MKAINRHTNITFFGLLFVILVTPTALAQVITPSMNPTTPVYMSAAAGWRTTPSVGASFFDRIGSRTYDSQNIYEFATTGYGASLGFNMGERLAFSANYTSETT